jgi:pimeloyl-ACP methyl ester carboxylesterase
LPTIKVPTLIVVGDLDIVTPVSSAEQIQKSISGSVLKIMKGVSHLPNRENPNEFNNILKEFLDGLKR